MGKIAVKPNEILIIRLAYPTAPVDDIILSHRSYNPFILYNQCHGMAPLKKPLFVPPPPATLDHFFAKADASINRSASSTFHAPKRVKTGLSMSHIKQKTKRRPQHIIVLDSDDDAPAVRAKRKAKDHAENSSDIEVVETEASSSEKKAKTGVGGSATEHLLTFPQDESLHFAEFGRPKLLIPTEDTQHEKSLASSGLSHESGVPASAPLGASARPSLGGPSSVLATTSTTCLENLIEIDDEWGTGDDELVRTNRSEFDDVLELTDDDDEVEDVLKVEDEPPSTSGDNNLNQCPFCGRCLTGLAPLVSSLLQSTVTSSHVYCSRIYNHILMTAAIPFLMQLLHRARPTTRLRHHCSLNAKCPLTATRSRSSCPRARRTTRGRKPRWLRTAVSGRRKRTVGEEKRRSTRSCRACPSPLMLSVMVRSPV